MKFQLMLLACVAATVRADTAVSLPVNGHSVPVTDVGAFDTAPTTRGGDLTYSNPDQTFSEEGDGQGVKVGVQDGKPVVQPSVTAIDGRRRLLAAYMGRKMLGEVELAGDGVSVGNDVVGEQANAYGHGEPGEPLPTLDNTHIQPHGVSSTTTLAGQDTTGEAGFNPDCVGEIEGYNEGKPCTYASGK